MHNGNQLPGPSTWFLISQDHVGDPRVLIFLKKYCFFHPVTSYNPDLYFFNQVAHVPSNIFPDLWLRAGMFSNLSLSADTMSASGELMEGLKG
jgi:hypothetical protein